MRAIRVPRHGGPEVLEIADLPDPRPGPGEVLVEVRAAGVNHLDTWVRRGLPGITLPLPMIPGSDAAGVIAASGPGVTAWKPGDRVFVSPGYSCGRCEACGSGQDPLCRDYGLRGEHRDGTQAGLVVLREDQVLPLPERLSFEEGAAFPLVFLTAWHMLAGRARVRPGDDVLIQAGGSGVGTAAIQIARLHGARVLATVGSDDKAAKAKALGADEVINYRTTDVLAAVRRATGKRGVDIVVESTGQDTWEKSIQCLVKGGRLVTCGATSGPKPDEDIRRIFQKQVTIYGSTMGTRHDWTQLNQLLAARTLRPVIDRTYPLEEAAQAQERMAHAEQFGKLVLTIPPLS